MAIPDYQTLMRPLLDYGADGSEKNIRDAIAFLADKFQLTPDERAQTIPSGKEPLISNRIHWARTYLSKARALERTRRSHFKVTDRGRDLLNQHPEGINIKVLEQFPEFVAFRTGKPQSDADVPPALPMPAAESNGDAAPDTKTPDERIFAAEAEINQRLQNDLLDRISEQKPAFFEGLVVDLIVKMGYGGGSKENILQRIGFSGDEGIDGIINEDALGLDVVYIQAKRYDQEKTISRGDVQSFAGALVGKNATKGIFVATCQFSKGAREYAERVPQRIILIDGRKLVQLLVQYEVGVRVDREIKIKKIDLDYFEQDDA